MSNAAFDALCKAQDIRNVKATIANMEAALVAGNVTEAERAYIARALPAEKDRLAWLRAN